MIEHPKYQLLAAIAGTLTIMAFSNLVFKVHMTKETTHLTFIWIFLGLTAQVLFITYGLLNGIYGIYIPSTVLLLGLSYILYTKLYYEMSNEIEKELKNKKIL